MIDVQCKAVTAQRSQDSRKTYFKVTSESSTPHLDVQRRKVKQLTTNSGAQTGKKIKRYSILRTGKTYQLLLGKLYSPLVTLKTVHRTTAFTLEDCLFYLGF